MEMFETYGKINPLRKLILDFKSAFRINPMTERFVRSRGMKPHLPKLRKKFYFASVASVFLMRPAIPGGVLVAPFVISWGLR